MYKREMKDVVKFLFPGTPLSMRENTVRLLEKRFPPDEEPDNLLKEAMHTLDPENRGLRVRILNYLRKVDPDYDV